jgi:hypothetical protein
MPRTSARKEFLQVLDDAAISVARARYENLIHTDTSSSGSPVSDNTSSGSWSPMLITPPSPISLPDSDLGSERHSSIDTESSGERDDARYVRLLGAIEALRDEVEKTRVLERPAEPPMRAPQLQLLAHFADHRPELFQKKLRVHPLIFDDILDQISNHAIFQNQSNNKQLPVAIQLGIFLNRAGHYGNACSPEDIAQWAGVSIGTVNNCTHHVMVAILDQHDEFLYIPDARSKDMRQAREFTKSRTCRSWRNGVFAVDGSAINLFAKPGLYGETFYDRKLNYLLNCQVD